MRKVLRRRRLLVICGPTATGKTKLSLHLSKLFGGELVSADSRQVYKEMDIGTGKDLPANSQFTIFNSQLGGFYEIDGVRIWGYDLISPKKEFSVAQYIKIAERVIEEIWKRGKLPVLVGGTGFYIKGVIDGIGTASIPKNLKLRESFKEKSSSELFEILANMDPVKAASMNTSDRKNPRRLVRAIEIASSNFKVQTSKFKADVLFVGVTAPKEVLYRKIEKRVEERLKKGIEEEIIKLLTLGVSWESQAMNSLGYKQWRQFFRDGKRDNQKVIEKWTTDEKNYAKRQIAWFKRDKRVNWFDSSKKNFARDVEKLVGKWYKA